MNEEFNIVATGYGGQGILTLADIIARAAFSQGYDVKQAELHGLAQRGGSLQIHVRFGKKICSPLVTGGKADLIIALDAIEALRACYFANNKTIFLVNKKVFKIDENINAILRKLKKYGRIYAIDADKIAEKLTGKTNYANTFILAYALARKILPLSKKNVWESLKEKVRAEFLEENRKVFNAGFR